MHSEEQARQIAALLMEKGYPKTFRFNGNLEWPVEKGLLLYRDDAHHEQYSAYQARIRLHADVYRHQYNDIISIAFHVGYSEKSEYTILCLEIFRHSPNFKGRYPEQMFPQGWTGIPSLKQVKEMVGADLKSQIRQLVDVLQQKGYKKDFIIGNGSAGPLHAGLEAYTSPCKGSLEESKLFPISIQTQTHYRSARDRIDCSFEIDYTEYGGFRLESMAISRYRSYNKEPSQRLLVPLYWDKIPTAEKVNKMYRLGGSTNKRVIWRR